MAKAAVCAGLLLCGAFFQFSHAFVHPSGMFRAPARILKMSDEDFPSDTSSEDFATTVTSRPVNDDPDMREALKKELLQLGAITSRGQFATEDEKDLAVDLVYRLEGLNPTSTTAGDDIYGTWELVYSDVEPFRSSPFFMAVREVFGDDDEKASQAFALHRAATSISEIGKVKQVLSPGQMSSEVDLKVGLFASVPFSLTATVVSTASMTEKSAEAFEITMDKTKVINSNVFKFLDSFDGVPVNSVFERLRGSVPPVTLNTYFLDDTMRISRTGDEHFFVYART
eukprot:CAMPEP_0113933674 /NCGR_PEP_ID=MMETSP1339-20121228/931_1 /TAXON_ID=94617 /ORGANISM="Fibrocapsa japonica" /LENGTH=283 /DNA_ID=CAMNT_0000935083 /DNA_START=61 /DNA_END=912 /DNA_ORIENTATION=- /assembly_acc=CAM_ASM_000762